MAFRKILLSSTTTHQTPNKMLSLMKNNNKMMMNGRMNYNSNNNITKMLLPTLLGNSNYSITPTRYLSSAAASKNSDNTWNKVIQIIDDEIKDLNPVSELEDELKSALSSYRISETGTVVKLEKKIGNAKLIASFDYAQLEVVEVTTDVNSDQLPVTVEYNVGGKTVLSIMGHAFRGEDENDEPYMTPVKVCTGSQDTYSPNFEDLDESLQDAIGTWLSSHGIDPDFFNNVMDYAVQKEEIAYQKWLNDLKSAVKKIEE
jgi:hypothetical protein